LFTETDDFLSRAYILTTSVRVGDIYRQLLPEFNSYMAAIAEQSTLPTPLSDQTAFFLSSVVKETVSGICAFPKLSGAELELYEFREQCIPKGNEVSLSASAAARRRSPGRAPETHRERDSRFRRGALSRNPSVLISTSNCRRYGLMSEK
jgi:hypothetical protein